MQKLVNQTEMLEALEAGLPVRAAFWPEQGSRRNPVAIVLIKGRAIPATFDPVMKAIGAGTEFTTRDHVDALFKIDGKYEMVLNWIPLTELRKPAHAYQWIVTEDE